MAMVTGVTVIAMGNTAATQVSIKACSSRKPNASDDKVYEAWDSAMDAKEEGRDCQCEYM